MKHKRSEAEFVKSQGGRFSRALTAATIATRSDARLCGCDKIREPLAWRAALAACGYEEKGIKVSGFAVPVGAGPITQEIQKVANEVFAAAAAAAAAAEVAKEA